MSRRVGRELAAARSQQVVDLNLIRERTESTYAPGTGAGGTHDTRDYYYAAEYDDASLNQSSLPSDGTTTKGGGGGAASADCSSDGGRAARRTRRTLRNSSSSADSSSSASTFLSKLSLRAELTTYVRPDVRAKVSAREFADATTTSGPTTQTPSEQLQLQQAARSTAGAHSSNDLKKNDGESTAAAAGVASSGAREQTTTAGQSQSQQQPQAGAPPPPPALQFGVGDALNFETLTQLRKVFFSRRDDGTAATTTTSTGGSADADKKKKKDDGKDGDDGKAAGDGRSSPDRQAASSSSPRSSSNSTSSPSSSSPSPRRRTASARDEDGLLLAACDSDTESSSGLHPHGSGGAASDPSNPDLDASAQNWSSRGLDLDEFIEEFGHIIGANLSRAELQTMFMKIDANSDGDVDWDEFTNWMLKMEAGAHSMNEDKSQGKMYVSHEQSGESPAYHRGMVSRIVSVNNASHHAYVSAGRDGTIRFWSSTTLETVNVEASNVEYLKANEWRDNVPGARAMIRAAHNCNNGRGGGGGGTGGGTGSKKLWITDICVMSMCNRLAVCAADRTISFFDLYTMDVACRVKMQQLPTSMAYHTNATNTSQYLTWGDDKGQIHVFKLMQHFNFDEGLDDYGEYAFQFWKGSSKKLLKQGLVYYFCKQLHSDWITNVMHITDIQPNILTCSLDGTIKFFNVDKKNAERVFSGHGTSGVQALVYLGSTKCMASCGVGRSILAWNPHTCSLMQTLHGHLAPVTHLVDDDANSRLISLSIDKNFKIWDTATWRCVQSITDTTNYRPDNCITAVLWDEDLQQWITAGNRLKIWQQHGTEGKAEMCSHAAPICSALWNRNFQQVVSGDASSVVQVWSIDTGQLVFRFDKLHGESKITSMAFDCSMRRLITGAHDGTVRMWNFSNGSQLKELLRNPETDQSDDDADAKTARNDTEVSAVAYILEEGGTDDIAHKFIVSCGWDKKLRIYIDDDDEEVEPYRMLPSPGFLGHTDDILCVVHCAPRLVATGSYNGEIIIWSLASGSGRFFMKLADYVDSSEVDEQQQQVKDSSGSRSNSRQGSLSYHGINSAAPSHSMMPRGGGGDDKFPEQQQQQQLRRLYVPQPPSQLNSSSKLSFTSEHRTVRETPPSSRPPSAGGPSNPTSRPPSASGPLSSSVHSPNKAPSSSSSSTRPPPQIPLRTTTNPNAATQNGGARGGANSPEPQSPEEAPSYTADAKKGKLAIDCLLFLKSKCVGEVFGQTLASAGADAKIRFWSVKDGSLCHLMRAGHPNDAGITCLTSDEELNTYLFTGCSGGYVKVWTLRSLEKAAQHRLHRRFSVAGGTFQSNESDDNTASFHKKAMDFASAQHEAKAAKATRRGSQLDRDSASVNLQSSSTKGRRMSVQEADYQLPKVYELAAWKAHDGALVSLIYMGTWQGKELLLSAGSDCNVSVWTVTGQHIGIFGQTSPWSLTDQSVWMDRKEHLFEKLQAGRQSNAAKKSYANLNSKGRGGILSGDEAAPSTKASGIDSDSDSASGDENGDADLGYAKGSKEDREARDAAKKKRQELRQRKKVLEQFQGIIKAAEQKLDSYHYELAKAKLDNKREQGKINAVNLIMKEAMFNERWGTGLQVGGDPAASGGGAVAMPALNATGGGNTSHSGGSGDAAHSASKFFLNPLDERKSKSESRMRSLRQHYNQVAHCLKVHAPTPVEACRGADLVNQKKGDGRRRPNDN